MLVLGQELTNRHANGGYLEVNSLPRAERMGIEEGSSELEISRRNRNSVCETSENTKTSLVIG